MGDILFTTRIVVRCAIWPRIGGNGFRLAATAATYFRQGGGFCRGGILIRREVSGFRRVWTGSQKKL